MRLRHFEGCTGRVLALLTGMGFLLACGSAALPAATRTTLRIVTAIEPEQQASFKRAIEAALPDIAVEWVYGHSGAVTDRLLARNDAAKGDVVLGLAATSLILLENAGLLESYRPAGADALRSQFTDQTPPYTWTGMDAYIGVLCVNTDVARAQRVSLPVTWRDLLQPNLKGRMVMPDPVASGTGYLLVAGWLQSMGEDRAWAFMDALDRNVASYLPSGAAPCDETAKGRYAVGLSFDGEGARLKAQGAPVNVLVPIDGTGWELEAFAILKGSSHPALARALVDWAASEAANTVYAETYAIVAHPRVSRAPASYPPYAEARMIRNDITWMANNRARVLAEWTRRYGGRRGMPQSAPPP